MVEFDDNLNPVDPTPSPQPGATPNPTAPANNARSSASLEQMVGRGSGFLVGIVLILVLVVLALGIGFYITRGNNSPGSPTTGQPEGLTVNGDATVYATPDIAKITLGVQKTGRASSEVQDALSETTTAIINAIKGAGIPESDIKTTGLNIYPQYATNNRITGYTGQHSLTITVNDLDKVDELTEVGTKAGANEIQGVTFTVSDPEKWWQDARTEALNRAKDKAQQIAKDAGIRLGKLISINEWSNQPWDGGGYGGGPMPARDLAIDTQPGSLELTVNVSLVYRIID